jgi:hypothetical protein
MVVSSAHGDSQLSFFYHSQWIKSTPIEAKSLARKGLLPSCPFWEFMGILALENERRLSPERCSPDPS